MEARELRIGNLVMCDRKRVVEFHGITEGHNKFILNYKNGSGIYYNKPYSVKPIPLTEEWHNKFGVKINGFKSFAYKLPRIKNIEISIIHDGDYIYFRQKNDNHPMNDSIISVWNKDLVKRDMYIHEWQNLYFALTGEELVIKE